MDIKSVAINQSGTQSWFHKAVSATLVVFLVSCLVFYPQEERQETGQHVEHLEGFLTASHGLAQIAEPIRPFEDQTFANTGRHLAQVALPPVPFPGKAYAGAPQQLVSRGTGGQDWTGDPAMSERCTAQGVVAILYSQKNFKGPFIVLSHSHSNLAHMLCFIPQSARMQPGIQLTLQGKWGQKTFSGSTGNLEVKEPTKASVCRMGLQGCVEVGETQGEVPNDAVLKAFKSRSHEGFVHHAENFRYFHGRRYLLKSLDHKTGKNKKEIFKGLPEPEACFMLTHVHDGQLQCHNDYAWEQIAHGFVPHFGGLTLNGKADIAAMHNALFGLKDADIVDLDTGARYPHMCGMDIKHVTLKLNAKRSLKRPDIMKLSWRKNGKPAAKNAVELVHRLLDGGGGVGRDPQRAAAALLPELRRLQGLLEQQTTATLLDSSILLVLGTNEMTGNLEARVRLIDFGKEVHVYSALFPVAKLGIGPAQMAGHRCAFACGAKELVMRMEKIAAGEGVGSNECMAPCMASVGKDKKCSPIAKDKRKAGW